MRDIELEEKLWKGPDWICPACHFVNLAIREKCRNCGFDSALVSGDHYFPVEEEDVSETKPITPEDLERLDALEKIYELSRYGPSHAEESQARAKFQCAVLDAQPAIRARIAELENQVYVARTDVSHRSNITHMLQRENEGLQAACRSNQATIAQQAQRIAELENLLAIQAAQLSALREPPVQTGTST